MENSNIKLSGLSVQPHGSLFIIPGTKPLKCSARNVLGVWICVT